MYIYFTHCPATSLACQTVFWWARSWVNCVYWKSYRIHRCCVKLFVSIANHIQHSHQFYCLFLVCSLYVRQSVCKCIWEFFVKIVFGSRCVRYLSVSFVKFECGRFVVHMTNAHQFSHSQRIDIWMQTVAIHNYVVIHQAVSPVPTTMCANKVPTSKIPTTASLALIHFLHHCWRYFAWPDVIIGKKFYTIWLQRPDHGVLFRLFSSLFIVRSNWCR